MTIIVYRDKDDIDIRFEDGYIIKNMHYCNFKTGKIKNPYEKRVCGIGYVGEGNYKTTIDKKHTKQYDIWRQIISRCYDTQTQIKRPTYIDCTVDERWFNYQNFAKWYDENYYEVDNEVMCLDKDILFKGNKIYSPETCCFVPENINVLFTKRQNCRGECPIGVYFNKRRGKYISQCNINNKNQIYIGAFDDCIDAFNSYKKFKENFIKQTADKYKHKIPQKLYDALYNYQVEITD